jgi:hypothetical protein
LSIIKYLEGGVSLEYLDKLQYEDYMVLVEAIKHMQEIEKEEMDKAERKAKKETKRR